MSDTEALSYAAPHLLIAGVPVQVDGWYDGTDIPENLRPFLRAGSMRPDEGITLRLEPGPPPAVPDGPLTSNGSSAALLEAEWLWVRVRCGSVAVADPGLAAWRCWNGVKPLPEEMSVGRRWLMLALWGYLTLRGGAYLHGSICVVDGRYLLFLGDSGVGKSTLSRLVLAAGGSCLTDENPLVTLDADGHPLAHATPVPGVRGPDVPLSGRLDAIFFLRHAPANDCRRLLPSEAGRRLLRNARFFHWLPATRPETMRILDAIARIVVCHDFGFVPEPSAVAVVRETLRTL